MTKLLTGWDMINYNGLNDVDANHVAEIAASIIANGWQGCPILVIGDTLFTGSHRVAALQMIANSDDPEAMARLDEYVGEDVTDIVSEHCERINEELGYMDDIDYSNIGKYLDGSWVEQYKDEIAEW